MIDFSGLFGQPPEVRYAASQPPGATSRGYSSGLPSGSVKPNVGSVSALTRTETGAVEVWWGFSNRPGLRPPRNVPP